MHRGAESNARPRVRSFVGALASTRCARVRPLVRRLVGKSPSHLRLADSAHLDLCSETRFCGADPLALLSLVQLPCVEVWASDPTSSSGHVLQLQLPPPYSASRRQQHAGHQHDRQATLWLVRHAVRWKSHPKARLRRVRDVGPRRLARRHLGARGRLSSL
ncbi:hypothetical protein L1887_62133 [Cichorium endivia]|nr:hypothetical protein L1887_62133 [Cichorium endivia]